MPDTDGISLLREWQQSQALTAPVVMMSGHGTVETAVEATRLGAIDYVEKPLSLAKLLRTVQKALDEGKRRKHAARTLVPPLIAPASACPIEPPSEYEPPSLSVAPPPSMEYHDNS